MPVLKKASDFLASYKLSCLLFLLLLLLTYLGTMNQVGEGLYQSQQKYFESVFLVHWAFGSVPVPLPGGYLVMVLTFANLLWGAVVRFRWAWSRVGILVAHTGILVLLAGSFVSYVYSESGHMVLYENESSDEFESSYAWEIGVSEAAAGSVTEYIIRQDDFDGLGGGKTRTFTFAGLPFDLTLGDYMPNAAPEGAGAGMPPQASGKLAALPPNREQEQNMAGITATLAEKPSGATHQAQLWAGSVSPVTVAAAGKQWNLSLRKLRWKLPFTLRLDQFKRELHPRTNMAREYSSNVTKIEGGDERPIRITMNEPLRHLGYTFYQSSWGPQNGGSNERFYSVFAVVRNPADQIPLVACIITTIGLVLHFMQRLLKYLKNERAGRKSALQRAAGLALLAAGVLLAGFGTAAAEDAPAPPQWDKDTLDLFATLPVQDEGRVKPLDTLAAFKLLKFHGSRRCPDVEGKNLSPTAWFINCVFYPDTAKQYKVFRVDNDEVIIAAGLLPKKKRDYYSYAELAPAREKLLTLGRQYMRKEEHQRTVMETELMSLGMNVREFEELISFADFARKRFSLAEHKEIAPLFPGQTECRVSDILRKAPDLFTAYMDLKKKSEPSAPELKNFSEFLRGIQESAGEAAVLALFPPPAGAAGEEWHSPADMVQIAFSGETLASGQIDLLAGFEDLAFSAADPEAFKKQASAFHGALAALAKARGEYGKIGLEVSLYRMQPFYNALILYVLSFILVACLWMRPGSRALAATSYVSILIPTLLLAAGITLRCVIRGRPPVTTLYETILFVTVVAVAVSLFMEWVNRQRVALSLASILGVVGMFVANKYEVREGSDTMVSMVAVLDTNFWLATHVTTITIGYAAGLLSGGLAHVFVLGKLLRLKRGNDDFYRGLTRMVYGSLCFSLVFSVVGTVLGGIWANESWGRFWGWDPKENGALMIVLWQLAILHARKDGMLRDYGVNIAAVIGGIVIAFSWFGVNMLGVGLHSYGFASGAHLALVGFYAFETAVALLGCAAWLRDHRRATV